jgi:hypothetical protein
MIAPQLLCNLCRGHMILEISGNAGPLETSGGLALDWKWTVPETKAVSGYIPPTIGDFKLIAAKFPERAEMHLCDKCCGELRRILGVAA